MTADAVQAAPIPRTATFDGSAWEIPHPAPFLCDLRIDAAHVSPVVPHVNNIVFMQWVDDVAALHADSLGYTRCELLRRGVMWFVARHEIDYLAEGWQGDDLVLATWVRTMHRVKSWRDTLIVRPADSTLLCRAATLWVLVDLGTRRPIRHDAQMVSRFAPLHPPAAHSQCTSP